MPKCNPVSLRNRATTLLCSLFTCCLFLLPQQSYAFDILGLFGLGNDSESATSALSDNPLTSLLTSQLGVNTEQAAGGAGALLALATSQLQGEQASELTSIIPGADSLMGAIPAGLGDMLSSTDTVNQAFKLLGMDSSMISQFIPLLTQFIGDQGASSDLVSSLSSIWTP